MGPVVQGLAERYEKSLSSVTCAGKPTDCRYQWGNCKENPKEFKAVAASVTTLSENINIIIVKMGGTDKGIVQPTNEYKMRK